MTSEEYELDKETIAEAALKLRKHRNQYAKDKARGEVQIRIRPSVAKELKSYYEEYVFTCQANQFIPVEFNEFIIQYAVRGFLNWREKNKGR